MHRKNLVPIFAAAMTLMASTTMASVEAPVIVSPGSSERIDVIEQRCPTFSWGTVRGAQAYELIVFDAPPTARLRQGATISNAADRLANSAPRLRVKIPASAASWTPSSVQCLDVGGTYSWYVREIGTYSPFVGEWSDGKIFRIVPEPESPAPGDTPQSDREDDDGRGPGASGGGTSGGAGPTGAPGGPSGPGGGQGNGTGGIPAVLQELAAIQQQMADNHAAVNLRLDEIEAKMAANQAALIARFDGVDAGLFDLDHDLFVHAEDMMPCTPQRWRDGKCEILEIEATVCFNVGLGAELGAEFAVEPGLEFSLGASWHEVPNAELTLGIDVPFLGSIGPIPFILPDVAAGLQAGADGGVEICVAGLTIPLGDEDKAGTVNAFTEKLVTALETRAGLITEQITAVLDERGLDGSRISETLAAFRDFRGGGLEGEDPVGILQRGKLRDFVNTLPVDEELRALLDEPGSLLPDFNEKRPLEVCDNIKPELLGGRAERICNFVDKMPDIEEMANRVKNMPAAVADQICDAIPFAECEGIGSRVTCRQTCRDRSRGCKSNCGFFDLSCKRSCERRKDDCIDCCNDSADPSGCGF